MAIEPPIVISWLFSFFENKKWKRNLLLKERKLSAVKLVSTGENKGWTQRTQACEKAGFDVEKKDIAFSKSILEIKSRKVKNEFLLFASLSAEKEGAGRLPRDSKKKAK